MDCVCTVEYLLNNTECINNIFELLYICETTNKKHVLLILSFLIELLPRSFECFTTAAKLTSTNYDSPPFMVLIELIKENDSETQMLALSLINELLKKAPNERKFTKILTRFRNLGIFDLLKTQADMSNKEVATQVKMFQVMAGKVLSTSEFVVDILIYIYIYIEGNIRKTIQGDGSAY